MPMRAGDPFFEEALLSLKQQTYPHWHCYLVADGEVERSGRLARSVLGSSCVTVLSYPIGKRGLATGLNFGLRHINESFTARLDSDDLSAPERFEQQVSIFKSKQGSVMVCSSASEVDTEGFVTGIRRLSGSPTTLHRQLELYNPVTHSSVMFLTSAVRQVGGYNPLARGCEDYDLWLRLLSAFPAGIFVIESPLVSYRRHSSQLTRKSMVGRQFSVVSQSKLALSTTKNPYKSQLGIRIKNVFWSAWQRLRFP
jgi:glycosyltransferase involved in cell wall biosynthesis